MSIKNLATQTKETRLGGLLRRVRVFILIFLTGFTGRVWALSLTPSIQSFVLKPGETIEGETVVVNTEDEPATIVPTTKSWFVLPENKSFAIEDWLQIKEKEFVLKPGESKKVNFRLHAPKKAQGELVGMLSFRTKTAVRSSVEFVMSGAVYLAIQGTEKVQGDIHAFMVDPGTSSVSAGVLLRNTGNVHLRPFGVLQILTEKDQVAANIELDQGQPTYPGAQRPYFGTVKDFRLPPGKYSAQIDLHDFDRQVFIHRRKQKFTLTEDRKVQF